MSRAEQILDAWCEHPVRGAPFVTRVREDGHPARFAPLPAWLPEPIKAGLRRRGVPELYTHQAEALGLIQAGRDVVIATPTASGKTLCYNLPTLATLRETPSARALYLFPTKALAQDQVAELRGLAAACEQAVGAFTFDGDTPQDARRAIRDGAQVVVSNPDMLHTGILPHHAKWQAFFSGLRLVVIDELHVYRGVFGSHVANVLRRLKRVAAWHGASPQFVTCSATIANPQAHAEALLERPVAAITESGAPVGRRSFYLYNPPVVDSATGLRQSYVKAARQVTLALAKADVPTIVFANTRLSVERLTRHLKEDVAKAGGDPESVAGYRGGYLPEHRRAIEAGLREGTIQTVISTSALELGVDIGQLEACVLAGYPGSVASTLQRAGRAGRRESPAAVVLVTRSEPVDQYLAHNPGFFFRPPEHARLSADNLLVVADHIKCAAFELPFSRGEAFGRLPGASVEEVLGWLAHQRVVHPGQSRWQWMAEPYPAQQVSLRNVADGNFTVLDQAHEDATVGEVDYHQAASTLHPQAIYIVAGQTYQVQRLDWAGRRALVLPVAVDYFTDAITFSGVQVLEAFDERPDGPVATGHGEVRVFERIVGFKKVRFATGENVGYGEVALPENELHTTALWLEPKDALLETARLPRHRLADALTGLGHAAIHVASVLLLGDPQDLGVAIGERALVPGEASAPCLFLYERYPGGVGQTDALFARLDELLGGVLALLAGCACQDGCPACVGASAPVSLAAGEPRSRTATLRFVEALREALAHGR